MNNEQVIALWRWYFSLEAKIAAADAEYRKVARTTAREYNHGRMDAFREMQGHLLFHILLPEE